MYAGLHISAWHDTSLSSILPLLNVVLPLTTLVPHWQDTHQDGGSKVRKRGPLCVSNVRRIRHSRLQSTLSGAL